MPFDTSYDGIYRLGATKIIVPIGATAAVFMQPQAGQIGWQLSLVGGQTIEIYSAALGSSNLGLGFGTTQTQAILAGFSGQGFFVGSGSSQPIQFPIMGPAQFYIGNSSGATQVVSTLLWFGQGT